MQATPLFAGIDWSWQHHAVCVVDDEGRRVQQATVAHSRSGLRTLTLTLRRLAVRRVAIERGDGPVVEHLLTEGFEVVVISPRQVRSLRARYGTAGNKDDRLDAFVLADALRTDAGRWKPVQPDSPATVALRMLVRTRQDLVTHRIAVHNQLLAVLQQHFPGAVGLFSGLDIPISLAFLRRFPTQAEAAWLTERRMAAWLGANGYCGRHTARHLVDHLQQAAQARQAAPAAAASQLIVRTLVDLLAQLRVQATALEARIHEALLAHPDGPVFASLPRAGTIRAATLLAELGTAAAATPTRPRSRPPPASRPQPGNQASSCALPSAAAATSTYAPRWSVGPKTPHAPTPGPGIPTSAHEREAAATPMPPASSPTPGPACCGAAGTTKRPTTPTGTAGSPPHQGGHLT